MARRTGYLSAALPIRLFCDEQDSSCIKVKHGRRHENRHSGECRSPGCATKMDFGPVSRTGQAFRRNDGTKHLLLSTALTGLTNLLAN